MTDLPCNLTFAGALAFANAHQLDRADAEILLAHAVQCNRARFFGFPEQTLTAAQNAEFSKLVQARAEGQPVAYLTGEREFYGLKFSVNARVLIPRPETELLVEQAIALLPEFPATALDLGTGSGAIACALAKSCPGISLWATDASEGALAIARQNAAALGLTQIEFRQGSWFEAIPFGLLFDVIVSNPPYLDADDPHLQQGDLRFEPQSALTPTNSAVGLADLQHIIDTAPHYLKPGAWLLLEHGYQQGEAVRAHFTQRGFTDITTLRDYSELDRVSYGRCFGQFSGS